MSWLTFSFKIKASYKKMVQMKMRNGQLCSKIILLLWICRSGERPARMLRYSHAAELWCKGYTQGKMLTTKIYLKELGLTKWSCLWLVLKNTMFSKQLSKKAVEMNNTVNTHNWWYKAQDKVPCTNWILLYKLIFMENLRNQWVIQIFH